MVYVRVWRAHTVPLVFGLGAPRKRAHELLPRLMLERVLRRLPLLRLSLLRGRLQSNR
jgi:hypothetical protein